MVRKLLILAAWCAFACIVFVTLSPVGLRPDTGSVGLERFAAYGVLGALFVAAYPRHFPRVMICIIAVALSLELLQHLTPDRHGRASDALEKVAGALAGCSFARLLQLLSAKLGGSGGAVRGSCE